MICSSSINSKSSDPLPTTNSNRSSSEANFLSNVIDPKKVYGEYLYVTKTSLGLQKHFYSLGEKLTKKNIITIFDLEYLLIY